MIKSKLIQARKDKRMTQNEVAGSIGMSQLQYQRRENGEIRISDNEWTRIAKVLDKDVDEIRENEPVSNVYNYDNHSGNYSASNNYFYNIPEFMMKNQQEYIGMLREKINTLQNRINLLEDEIARLS